MNKKIIVGAALMATCLTACGGGKCTFYGQKFTFKNDVCYSFSSKSVEEGKTFEEVLKEQIKNENVNWDKTGFYTSLLIDYVVTPFSNYGSYDAMVAAMKTDGTAAFRLVYNNFSLEVSDFKTKTASISYKGEAKTYNIEAYGEDNDECEYLYMNGDDGKVGYITTASLVGYGCHNGKWDCIEVEYAGVVNKSVCVMTFNNPVKWRGENTNYLTWSLYAKIAN